MPHPYKGEKVEIRQATTADFLRILPLLEGFGRLEPDGAQERFESIVQLPDRAVFVAEIEDGLVGYAFVQGYGPRLRSGEESARLHDLFTLPEYRNRGIARALLEAVKNWCRARGSRYLEWQSSKYAVAFYESLGLKGDPCPQPEYPFFEIDFAAEVSKNEPT